MLGSATPQGLCRRYLSRSRPYVAQRGGKRLEPIDPIPQAIRSAVVVVRHFSAPLFTSVVMRDNDNQVFVALYIRSTNRRTASAAASAVAASSR